MAKVAVRSVHRHGYIDETTIGPPEDDGALPSTDAPPPSYNLVGIGPDDTIGALVSKVKAWALAQGGVGHTLNFWSHGAPGYLYLGKDGISSANVAALAPLAPFFNTVRISGCNVAYGEAGKTFCKTLAKTLGATVEAGVEVQTSTQILSGGAFVDDDKFEGAYFRFSPAGVMTGPFSDRKSVLGQWKFDIPNWQGATASERYKTGWTGILHLDRPSKSPRGAAGAPETGLTSGDCFWHPLTSLAGNNGTWLYYLTEASSKVVEHLSFEFEDDGRKFVGDLVNNVCEGYYTNPGWPNGYFRLTKKTPR